MTRLTQVGLGAAVTVAATGLLFGFIHIFEGWLYVAIITLQGFLLGWFFLKQRRIWPLMIAHALYNLLGVLFIFNHLA